MISIRVDDFPHTKGEPLHTLDNFRMFEEALIDATGVSSYLLGVIPLRLEPSHIGFLKSSPCVVGMHGIQHDEDQLDRFQNEFPPWMTVQEVSSALIHSRDFLERSCEKSVNVYMPPRNRIDRRTTTALGLAGFKAVTGGPETDQPSLLGFRSFMSLPPHAYGRTDEMLDRGSTDVLSKIDQDVVLTLHWTWEINIGLHHMKRFFNSIDREMFTSFPSVV